MPAVCVSAPPKIHHLFDAFTTIDEVEKDKSLPDIYIHAAEKLRVSNEDCIVFEDILAGVKGAKRAGMRVYGVYDFYSVHERSEIEEIVDGYITDFYELTKE